MAQKVYKCGSNYSQIPCEEAVKVNAADARSSSQKSDTDKATVRDMQAAKAMEKERLAQEKQALASGKESAKVIEKISAEQAPKAKQPDKDEVHKGEAPKKKPKSAAEEKAAEKARNG
jgi:hypothetical protein